MNGWPINLTARGNSLSTRIFGIWRRFWQNSLHTLLLMVPKLLPQHIALHVHLNASSASPRLPNVRLEWNRHMLHAFQILQSFVKLLVARCPRWYWRPSCLSELDFLRRGQCGGRSRCGIGRREAKIDAVSAARYSSVVFQSAASVISSAKSSTICFTAIRDAFSSSSLKVGVNPIWNGAPVRYQQ